MPLTAVKSSRRTVSFRPVTEGASYAGGQLMRLQVSGVDFIDPANFHLNFRMNVAYDTGVAGDTTAGGIALPMSAESYIDEITVRVGGRVLDNVRNYAEIESFLHTVSQSTDSVNSLGACITGQTLNDVDRIIPFSAAAGVPGNSQYQDAWYSVDLSGLALFGSNMNMVPIRYLAARQPVEIEIRLRAPAECLTYYRATGTNSVDPTNVRYTMSEVYITADALDMDAVSLAWDERILTEPMVYPVSSITQYSSQLLASQTTYNTVFSHPGEDVRMAVVMFTCNGIRDLASADSPLAVSDMNFIPPFLQEAQLKVGVRLFPETDRLKFVWKGTNTPGTNLPSSAPQSLREAIKAVGRSADHRSGFLLTPELYSKNKYPIQTGTPSYLETDGNYRTSFGLAFSLDSNPSELTPDVAGTGVSTLSATTHNITLNMYFSAARGAYDQNTNPMGGDYTVDIFMFTRENYVIFADRVEREINLVLPGTEEA